MPRGDIDRIAELEGAMKAKDDQLSSLRSQLAEKETQLDSANNSNSALSREIGGLKANIESLTAERDGINKNLEEARRLLREKTLKLTEAEGRIDELEARDPAEQVRLAHEQAAAARLEEEKAEKRAAARREAEAAEQKTIATQKKKTETREMVWMQVRASLIMLGLLLAFFGLAYFWWDVEFDFWTYIGTLVIVPAVVGLLPQLSDHFERGGKWANEGKRGLAICAIIAGTIGLLVAILGIGGESWMVWPIRLGVFLGYGVYIFTGCYLLWKLPANNKWWGLLPATVFAMIISLMGAFIIHPIRFDIEGIAKRGIITPPEHLVNMGIWLVCTVLVSGLAALIAAPGLELFRKGLGRLNQKKRQSDRWMLVARIIIFVAACVVAWLMARSLWPTDGETGMKVLSVAVGILTFVGFSWLKNRLFWAADERKPYGRVLAMSIFVVFCTSLISGSVFYEANSMDDRVLALKTDIGNLQQAFSTAAKPVADRYAAAATDQAAKKAYETCVADMEKFMAETQAATSYHDVRNANDAFKNAGGLVANRLDKKDLGLMETLKVPTKPSTMNLYVSSIGKLFRIGTLPDGVKEVYVGALVMSALMLFMAEFMVLIVFFAMLRRKSEVQGPPQHDGYVVSLLYEGEDTGPALAAHAAPTQPDEEDERGTKFLVTCAPGTEIGDDIGVLGENDQVMAVIKVKAQPGDAAFICERTATKGMKPINNGNFVRVLT